MTLIVFAGPSLSRGVPDGLSHVSFRPPAECGDIARAILEGPRAIGLIDGRFETTASPWHKEILWGLSRGIAVFGAASMGALRAVELEPYGMVGVGCVFDAYRRGVIDGDDEVAVLHGPSEIGYIPLTEAMVNIRASLERACGAGIIGADEMARLTSRAKSLFYKERIWERVLGGNDDADIPRPKLRKLGAWLRRHAVDIKHQDACELLETITAYRSCAAQPRRLPQFVNTVYFDDLLARLSQAS
jgi:hypothetical protein